MFHRKGSLQTVFVFQYEKEEDAVKTREALHGARWPQSNPKLLRVDFATPEEVDSICFTFIFTFPVIIVSLLSHSAG